MWFSLSDLSDEVSLCLLRQGTVPQDDHDWDAYGRLATLEVPSEILRPLNELVDKTASAETEPAESARWILQTCIPMAWCGLMVGAAMKELSNEILLGNDVRRRVAVFFAEGDDFLLGEVSTRGFHFFRPHTDSP